MEWFRNNLIFVIIYESCEFFSSKRKKLRYMTSQISKQNRKLFKTREELKQSFVTLVQHKISAEFRWLNKFLAVKKDFKRVAKKLI